MHQNSKAEGLYTLSIYISEFLSQVHQNRCFLTVKDKLLIRAIRLIKNES